MHRISVSAFLVFLALSTSSIAIACSSRDSSTEGSVQRYLDEIAPSVVKYNSARDEVDEIIWDIDYGDIPPNRIEFLTERVAILENAVFEMNGASRVFGQYKSPYQFQPHQSATLNAWRVGIEAAIIMKLYIQDFLDSGRNNIDLVIQANEKFAEEDRFQLEARNAFQR